MRRLTADALVGQVARADVVARLPACRRQPSGEQRLLAAVLDRTLLDAKAGDRAARAWLASDAPSTGTGFGFVEVSALLDIEPAWVRALLRASTS